MLRNSAGSVSDYGAMVSKRSARISKEKLLDSELGKVAEKCTGVKFLLTTIRHVSDASTKHECSKYRYFPRLTRKDAFGT